MSHDALRRYEANIPQACREEVVAYGVKTAVHATAKLEEALRMCDYTAAMLYTRRILHMKEAGIYLHVEHVVMAVQVLYSMLDVNHCEALTIPQLREVAHTIAAVLQRVRVSDMKGTMTLDWSVCFRHLNLLLHPNRPPSTKGPLCGSEEVSQYRNDIVRMTTKVRPYFASDSTRAILEAVMPRMEPFHSGLFESQLLLRLLLPVDDPTEASAWFDVVLETLAWSDHCSHSLACILDLYARTARFTVSKRGSNAVLNWKAALPLLINRFLHVLRLPSSHKQQDKAANTNRDWPKYCSSMLQKNYKNKMGESVAQLLVYLMDIDTKENEDPFSCFYTMDQIFATTRDFYHASSSSGSWTGPLASLLEHLATMYAKRLQHHDGAVSRSKMVELLVPQAMTAMYHQDRAMQLAAHAVLKNIGFVHPESVFPSLMEEIVTAITPDSHSHSHRTLCALGCLRAVADTLLNPKLYPESSQFLERLLYDALPGIDPNDIWKSASALMFYNTLFCSMAIRLPSDEAYRTDDYNEEFAFNTMKGMTSWITQFLDKFLYFVSKLDKYEEKSMVDQIVMLALLEVSRNFFQCLQGELWHMTFQHVLRHFQDNWDNSKCHKYYGVVCRMLVSSNPQEGLSLFLNEMESGVIDAKGQLHPETSTAVLSWNMYLLSQAVRHSGNAAVPLLPRIQHMISVSDEQDDRKLRKMSRKLIRNTLHALLSTYPTEYHCFFPEQWTKEAWKSWQDNFQAFDLNENPNDLQLTWYVPSETERSAATVFATQYLSNSTAADTESNIRANLRVNAVLEGCESALGDFEGKKQDRFPTEAVPYETVAVPSFSSEHVISIKGQSLRAWALQHALAALDRIDVSRLETEHARSIIKVMEHCLLGIEMHNAKLDGRQKLNEYFLRINRSSYSKYRYTFRGLLVAKAELLHSKRLRYMHSHVSFTAAVENLMQELIPLALHDDPVIRDKSNDVLKRFSSAFPAERVFDSILQALQVEGAPQNKLLGALSFAKSRIFRKLAFKDMDRLNGTIRALCACNGQGNDLIQTQVHEVFLDVLKHARPLTPPCGSPQDAKRASAVASKHRRFWKTYTELMAHLTTLIKTPGELHWRYDMMVRAWFFALLPLDNLDRLPNDTLKTIVDGVFDSLTHIRRISMLTLTVILDANKNTSKNADESWNGFKAVQPSAPKEGYLTGEALRLVVKPIELLTESLFHAMEEDHPKEDQPKNAAGAGLDILKVIPVFQSHSDLPTTRLFNSNSYFDPMHVSLLELLFLHYDSLWDAGLNYLNKKLASVDDHETMQFATELFAGLALASEDSAAREARLLKLVGTLLIAIDKCSLKNLTNWVSSMLLLASNASSTAVQRFHASVCLPLAEGMQSLAPLSVYRRLQVIQPFFVARPTLGMHLYATIRDEILPLLLSSSQQVRQEVARVLCLVLRSDFTIDESFKANSAGKEVQELISTVKSKVSNNEADAQALETCMFTLIHCFSVSDVVVFQDFALPLLPAVFEASKHSQSDVVAITKQCIALFKDSLFPKVSIDALTGVLDRAGHIDYWRSRLDVLLAISSFTFNHGMVMTKKQTRACADLLIEAMRDSHLEVREYASLCLSKVIASSGPKVSIPKLKKRFLKAAKTEFAKTSDPQFLERHSGVLGLCALVYSEPHEVPAWLPSTLASLANFAFEPAPINGIVTKSLLEFKRTHQLMWHVFESRFTRDELDAINAVNPAPSYFA